MTRLPEFIDPWRGCDQGMRAKGTVEASQLARTPCLLNDPQGTVQFELEFFRDDHKRHCVRGRIWGNLWLACQRCLAPVEMRVDVKLVLALVRKYEEVAHLPDKYESLIVTNDKIRFLDLIEDEIILALPYVPLHHDVDACNIWEPVASSTMATQFQPEDVDTPFQTLERLKNRLH